MSLELVDCLGEHGILVAGILYFRFHVGQKLLVGVEAGLDGGKVAAYFGAAVGIVALVHIVEQALLHVDGVETRVDVAHKEHQGIVEVGSFLVFLGEVCDLGGILVEFLFIACT